MRWAGLSCLLAMGVGLIAGCANVKVKKVDVDRRIAGKDNHVKGFRYYLNRPYIVVGKPISVSTVLVPVSMASYPQISQEPDPKKRHIVFVGMVPPTGSKVPLVYDTAGRPIPGVTPDIVDPVKQGQAPPPILAGSVAPQPDDATILARTYAAVVDVGLEAMPAPPNLRGEINNAVDAIAKQDKVQGSTLQEYGGNAAGVYSKAALDVIVAHLPIVVTPDVAKRAGSDSGFVAGELFAIQPKPPSRPTMLARAVGTYAFFKVDAIVNEPTLAAGKPGGKALLGRLVVVAEESFTKPVSAIPPKTLKDVVSEAVKAIQGPGKVSITDPTVPASALPKVQAALKSINDVDLINQLLTTQALRDQSTSAPKPLPLPSSVVGQFAFSPNTAAAGAPAPGAPAPGNQAPSTPVVNDPAAIQVMYLPDFEEQYAIRNKNFLARTKYQYKFSNGTELSTITGNYNATDVPVKLLETVGTLIQAAGSIAKQQLNPGATITGASLAFTPQIDDAPFYVKIEQVIEPGVYRIQKSWERVAAVPTDGLGLQEVQGMFSEIGLRIVPVNSVITADQYNNVEKKKVQDKFNKAAGIAAPGAPQSPASSP